jgi:acyl carrier protein
MQKSEIEAVVIGAIAAANQARLPDQQLNATPEAPLFGPGSPLDSIGLVGLLIDVEEALRDQGVEVELSDSRAMSATRSPFRSVSSLVVYIDGLLAQQA